MGLFRKRGTSSEQSRPDPLADFIQDGRSGDRSDDRSQVEADDVADDVAADGPTDRPNDSVDAGTGTGTGTGTGPGPGAERRDGPWDVSERSPDEDYIDLGAIRLPGVDGAEIRLDVDEASGAVTAATVLVSGSAVQLQAFAAPRSEGIWAEIRQDILTGISGQGGTADEVPGVFGYELLAKIPARSADGKTVTQVTRFAGVDGPRWFLRAVFHGPAAYDTDAATALEEMVRGIVVVRGPEAMAPRELLALRLPPALTEPAADAGADPDAPDGGAAAGRRSKYDDLNPFERGPEITEVR